MLKKIMLPVVLFFMLLSTCVVVNAADYPDIPFNLEYEYTLIYARSDLSIYSLLNTDIPLFMDNSSLLYDTSCDTNYAWYVNSGDSWDMEDITIGLHNHTQSSVITTGFGKTWNIVYANYDVFDLEGNVVFQKPSEPLGIPGETLAEMIQPEIVLQEVIAILPMILVCLVGYLALRKALAALQAILHQA